MTFNNNVNSSSSKIIINGKLIDLANLTDYKDVLNETFLIKGINGIIRFNGYSNLSVAKHSLHLAKLVKRHAELLFTSNKKLNDAIFKPSPEEKQRITQRIVKKLVLDALVHDFSEAITGDIIRPIKTMLPQIKEIESGIDEELRAFFGAPKKMSVLVDVLDKTVGTLEAYLLTRFYGKTLIDESNEEQLKAFNLAFSLFAFNDLKQLYPQEFSNLFDEITENITRPLTYRQIERFLSASASFQKEATAPSNEKAVSFTKQFLDIVNLSEVELLEEYSQMLSWTMSENNIVEKTCLSKLNSQISQILPKD